MRTSRRRAGMAALVSVAVHALLLAAALLLVRRPVHLAAVPDEHPATVQLVMSPPGGVPPPPTHHPAPRAPVVADAQRPGAAPPASAVPAPASRPPVSRPPVPPPPAPPPPAPLPALAPSPATQAPPPTQAGTVPPPESAAAATPPSPTAAASPPPSATGAARPPPAPASALPPGETAAAPPPPPPTPPHVDDALKFNFATAESDTNALVTGDFVVPASPDIKFHNRKPSYPSEAALRGEQGAVVLLVHVAADGLVSGVQVLRSSGYPALDRAALDAVVTWHFLPSVKNGQAVPTTVPARFVFALD